MPLYAYTIIPCNIDNGKSNTKSYTAAYYKIANIIDNMNITHEFQKILTIAFREDVFYGYCHEMESSFFTRQLPSDYCRISGIEDGIYTFDFDFSYFNSRKERLPEYGDEFEQKYLKYAGDKERGIKGDTKLKWQEIDSKSSICIKINEDIYSYPIPPFAGILEDLYDIYDYKSLYKARTELDNTTLLAFKLPTDPDTNTVTMDDPTRQKYYRELCDQVNERIGVSLTPFSSEKYTFDKSTVGVDNVGQAEQEYFNSAGVSQMLFNGNKSSSAALEYSIESDFDIVRGALRQLERWLNRRLKYADKRYKFKVKLLDISSYNQDKVFKRIKDACTLGAPLKGVMMASLGYTPLDVLNLGFLENDVLKLRDTVFSEPLLSSNTLSNADSVGGRPKSEEPLSETGEQTKEDDENENRAK